MPNVGDIVNVTNGVVNAYNGEVTTSNAMTPGMKTYYNTRMLENMRPKLVFGQFGKKHPLPANHGMSIEWRKWKTMPDIGRLQEGVIPQGKKFGQTATTAAIAQYGDYVTVSDILEMHHVDPVITGAQEEMSAAAAKTMDTLHRDAILAGATNVMYADAVNVAEGYKHVSTPLAAYELTAKNEAFCLLTPDMVAQAKTQMEASNVPKVDGRWYVCVVHPFATYDLIRHPEWNDFHKYAATEEIFAGEIGELYGVRFVETTNAPVMVGAPLFDASQRYLTVKSYNGFGSAAGPIANGFGEASSASVVVNETLKSAEADYEALIGQYVLCAKADGTIEDRIIVVGVDTQSNTIYLEGPAMGLAAGDFLLPGNGGAETKADNEAVAVFGSIFMGQDAFGIVDPDGGAIQMIVKQRGEIGGPLEQFASIGVKFSTGTKILYPERCIVLYHTGKYSDRAQANWRL